NSIVRNVVETGGNLVVQTLAGIARSTDNGVTWSTLGGGLPTYSGASGSLAEKDGILYSAIYYDGVYISADGGNTWTHPGSAEGVPTTSPVSWFTESDTVFLGCAGGKIYTTTDDGASWSDFTGTGIPSFHVVECFAMYNGEIYAGTNSGIYRRSLSGSSITENKKEYKLEVYPNPAHNTLNLHFENAEALFTHYTILNGAGQLVHTGEFTHAQIDVSILDKGIYTLFMTNDNSSVSSTFIKN
ncbi:MAG TPA: T9SS type A sorting domain-containing protein, partial [Flavobacteriales bacterium]|nr:T9SS type A sorting domain-containing protein [Flavobacteriales bacterium]